MDVGVTTAGSPADVLAELWRTGRLVAEYPRVRDLLAEAPDATLARAGWLLARLDPDEIQREHPSVPSVTVAITGQDGFNADQAISFTTNPGGFTLGICPVGGTEPICSLSPTAVPEVMDTITPPGVAQDTELNPIPGPVVLQGVTVP